MNKTTTLIVVLITLIIGIGGHFLFNTGGEVQVPVNGRDDAVREKDTTSPGDSVKEKNVKTFEVSGKNFEFSVEEIRVKKGDTVRLTFTSESGFHDFVIDEFDARTRQSQAPASETIEFVADKVGEFDYYCSVGRHRAMGMVGTLIVEE
jgi:plastocyanin